jgi:flagellar hook-associated protein 3 FlgL
MTISSRISTLGQHQSLLADVLRNENRVYVGQNQVTSGMKSDIDKGIAHDIGTLQGAKSLLARQQQLIDANHQVDRRLSLYDASLEGLRDNAQQLRDAFLAAINGNTGFGLETNVENIFNNAVSLLSTRDSGRYIFSGTLTDQSPLDESGTTNAVTKSGMQAINASISTTPSLAFTNNGVKQSNTIDENLTLTYGVLADEVAAPLWEEFRQFFEQEALGSFTNPLSNAQQTFLISRLDELNAAIDNIDQKHAQTGVNRATLQDIQSRLGDAKTFTRIFISDIEEVDVAEAIGRLSQDQVALDASYRVFSQLSRSTLLDFI